MKIAFIIHRSEIIRRGLSSIIKSYFHLEVILLESGKELDNYSHIRDRTIILIADPDVLVLNKNLPLFRNNVVKTIGIGTDNPDPLLWNILIDVKSSAASIYKTISGLFKANVDNLNSKVEGEELTHREKEVLTLVALGNQNKDIADKLFISIHTVISHRKNITEKLGIKSISGLTVYAIMNKLIDTNEIDPEKLI